MYTYHCNNLLKRSIHWIYNLMVLGPIITKCIIHSNACNYIDSHINFLYKQVINTHINNLFYASLTNNIVQFLT